MNKDLILFHLREMRLHLSDTITELENGEIGEDDWGALSVGLGHTLDHLCYAWNARDLSFENDQKLSQEEFEKLTDGVPNFGQNRYLVQDAL